MTKGLNTKPVSARVELAVKRGAEFVFERHGLSHAEAIRLFYAQVYVTQELPFKFVLDDLNRAEPDEQEMV